MVKTTNPGLSYSSEMQLLPQHVGVITQLLCCISFMMTLLLYSTQLDQCAANPMPEISASVSPKSISRPGLSYSNGIQLLPVHTAAAARETEEGKSK